MTAPARPLEPRCCRIALLLRENKINESLVNQMLGWQHSGFSVHTAVRLEAGDTEGLRRLARYMLRCPFSLARLIRTTERGQVIYRAEKSTPRRFPKPASETLFGHTSRNFQIFDPMDFIAEITQHIPDHGRHLIRYYGFYSNKTRRLRAVGRGHRRGAVSRRRPARGRAVHPGGGRSHRPCPGPPRRQGATRLRDGPAWPTGRRWPGRRTPACC